MAGEQTRDRLLDAAEQVLRREGASALSIRRVTSEAGMNVAAVNYVFGSKQALVSALLGRLLEPISRDRIERLDALPPDAGVDVIVRAFLEPLLALGQSQGAVLSRLSGLLATEDADAVLASGLTWLEPGVRRFERALTAALPHLDEDVIHVRVRLLIGTAVFYGVVLRTELGTPDAAECLADFVIAGVSAPHSRPSPY